MPNLLLIDELDKELNRKELALEDRCYYFFTYDKESELFPGSPRSRIKNFKRTPSELTQHNSFPYFKDCEVEYFAGLIVSELKEQPDFLNYLWIPVAPSKSKNDPEYDDRLIKVLRLVKNKIPSFIFEDIMTTKNSTDPSHLSNNRNIKQKIENLDVNIELLNNIKLKKAILFDDMITTGATYAAYKQILNFHDFFDIEGFFICKAVRSS